MAERELTTLEHIVLGLIAREPQSGYSIISLLETGNHRWSASPGAIYPILKRLEKQECITGELELVYETRPRKMYTLTAHGGELLDQWLRARLSWNEVMDERDIVMIKFQFMELRLPREDVIAWLDEFEAMTNDYDPQQRSFLSAAGSANEESSLLRSLHQELIHEATMMELNMLRTWIQLARRRLQNERQLDPEDSIW